MSEILQFLKDELIKEYGTETAEQIMLGYSALRSVTLRANTLKTNIETLKTQLREMGIAFHEVEWYSDALILESCTEEELRKT
ncbi:MAG: hypothetical protein K2N74_04735, partial [Clostridiales bacterium]|nr:hypothetical protein [Clostridiales bacterium]